MKIECTEVLKGHTGKVWCVKWAPRGDLLASCGQDTTVRLWAKPSSSCNWKVKAVLKDAHQKTVREVAWSPCGRFLASASFDATTAVWDSLSGQFECNATLEGHENEVKSVSWSPSGNYLATCSRDKSVWIWEVETTDEYDCSAVLNAHSQDVKRVRWSPKGDVLASASYDDTVKLYAECPSTSDWTCLGTLKSHESTVWSVAFDPTGDRLASVSDDKTLKIWNAYKPGNPEGVATEDNFPTWKCVCTVSGQHDGPIYDVDWSRHEDSSYLLTASGDNCIRIFAEASSCSERNAPTLTMIASCHNAHDQDVNSVAWHPTEPGVFASASDDSTVKIWRLVDD